MRPQIVHYWAEWLDQKAQIRDRRKMAFTHYDLLLKCVWKNLGENSVKPMVLQDGGKMITRVILLTHDDSIVNVTTCYLSKGNREEVGKCILECAILLIRELFLDPEVKHQVYWMNIVQLILDYADYYQLSRIVDVILTEYELYGTNKSIWKYNLFNGDSIFVVWYRRYTENMPGKIDQFLKCVSEKLGENTVNKLVIQGEVIDNAILSFDQERFTNAFLNNLTQLSQF